MDYSDIVIASHVNAQYSTTRGLGKHIKPFGCVSCNRICRLASDYDDLIGCYDMREAGFEKPAGVARVTEEEERIFLVDDGDEWYSSDFYVTKIEYDKIVILVLTDSENERIEVEMSSEFKLTVRGNEAFLIYARKRRG